MRRAVAVLLAMLCAVAVTSCSQSPGPSSSPRPIAGAGVRTAVPAAAGDPAVVPTISDDPASLGRELVAAERAVRARGTSRTRLGVAARIAQAAYGRLGQHPGWDAAVLRLAPRSLRRVIAANLVARRQLRAIGSSAPPSGRLPAWRIQAPAPAGRLMTWYRRAGRRFGVGWQYLAAVNLIETTFGKVRGLSSVGAKGPMQFMPSTWAAYGAGGNVNDPRAAIFAAARYLADHGFARGHVARALYAYNPTMHYVRAVAAIASVLAADPRSFAGYYRWDVYYPTSAGVLLLPQGFDRRHPTSARAYARAHPRRVVH